MNENLSMLRSLGWNAFFAEAFEAFAGRELIPARVALQHRTHYILYSEHGELKGEVTGKLQFQATGPQDLPAVGDWVVVHARPQEGAATILEVLPRKSKFSRKVAGKKTEEQIVAANIDVVFIVAGLDGDFNLRRLERYLVVASQSGASPVIILNKADLHMDLGPLEKDVRGIAGTAEVLTMSALKREGLDVIRGTLHEGITGALLGSSAVGKTTIINGLLGGKGRKTAEVREADSRGRHTTTVRELIRIPGGGLLIDTPGMRELQLWGEQDGMGDVFEDIQALAEQCRFRDCSHEVEPGCAVIEAMEKGELDPGRYESYRKLLRELAYQNRKHDEVAQRKEKERIKKIMVSYKKFLKKGGGKRG